MYIVVFLWDFLYLQNNFRACGVALEMLWMTFYWLYVTYILSTNYRYLLISCMVKLWDTTLLKTLT